MATSDITSHKYADIANTIPDAISAISLKTPKYRSINCIINAHLGLEGSQDADDVISHDEISAAGALENQTGSTGMVIDDAIEDGHGGNGCLLYTSPSPRDLP